MTGTSPDVLKAMFIYSECSLVGSSIGGSSLIFLAWLLAMGIDFTILVVTTSGLWFVVPGGGGGFWKMLFVDGIAYFSLIASVNTIPAVCSRLVPLSWAFLTFLASIPRVRYSTSWISIVRTIFHRQYVFVT